MHIEPGAGEAARDHTAVHGVIRDVLRVSGSASLHRLDLRYPGTCAFAYEVQTARRSGEQLPGAERLAELAAQSRASAGRASKSPCPSWQVDLAPPEPHLRGSLERALRQAPARNEPTTAKQGDWSEAEHEVLCAAGCRLAVVWPEMLAELQECVRQVVLIDSNRIAGFTDFITHGVVFVNRRRFQDSNSGLPAVVHCAEAMVHEGTHNRCNAANVARPFLVSRAPAGLVETPLRSDPRPLAGLFQQLVVLERSCELYERLLDAEDQPQREILRGRHSQLLEQAEHAMGVLREHQGALSDHGRAVADEAETRAAARRVVRAS